ncbi:MAG: glycoside hydrolase family 43 protein [Verrucomicrobia bacterium]|nr:glycoside hydrolase family 43 protein [Verrucomicrobiota bacterium]
MKPTASNHRISRLCSAAVLSLGVWLSSLAPVLAESTNSVLLFSFFRNNGEDGLYLATSRDGLKWTEIKPRGKSFLRPEVGGKLMRDPCLAQGPDGTFHMVWTTGWNKPPLAGHAQSRDLLTWSEQKAIPVMSHEPEARNVWAPEIFFDEAKQQWLLFWSTTIPGRFPATEKTGDDGWNHRIYFTTTKDFQTFAPTKLFFDGGFNVIDATLLQARGQYHLIVKDETKTPVKKHLRIATSDRAEGPFSAAGSPFTGDWVEGPSAIQIGGEFLVYFDHYARPQYYGAVKSRDLRQWEDISKQISFPPGARHGTVLRVGESVVMKLEAASAEK